MFYDKLHFMNKPRRIQSDRYFNHLRLTIAFCNNEPNITISGISSVKRYSYGIEITVEKNGKYEMPRTGKLFKNNKTLNIDFDSTTKFIIPWDNISAIIMSKED